VFAAAGTAIGSTLKDMQGFQMVMNFLVRLGAGAALTIVGAWRFSKIEV
jgi:hypothetical protein